jgi:S-adenosylmethionine decarboxylase
MTGVEWIVEAYGCSPDRLRDAAALRAVFDRIVSDLGLHPVGDALWHRFPRSGGLTGVAVLAESHLACHSFPEHGTICLNLFCCRARPDWDFAGHLRALLDAEAVNVRRVDRPYGASAAAPGVSSVAEIGRE